MLKGAATILMLAFALTMLFPLLWMLSASAKFEKDVFNFPVEWIPRHSNIVNNYRLVWVDNDFVLYYWNTIKVTVLTTLTQVSISLMGAYAFAKIDFRFKNVIFMGYLATLMVPGQVTIVPTFMLFRWLRLTDTHLGLVLLGSFSVYGVFLLRQYMMGIPNEINQAAYIDGAGHPAVFLHLIVPIARPAVATLMILKFIWVWNDYQSPLIFLNTNALYTIQVAIASFREEYSMYYAQMMTAAVSAILPLVIVFIVGQKNVIEGISIGAVKG